MIDFTPGIAVGYGSSVYHNIPYPLQTSTERLIAECDEMLEKLMEMKKKLREMM